MESIEESLRLLGIKAEDNSGVTEEEIRLMIGLSAESGTVEESEAELLNRVFHFGDRRVHEVMVPRTEVIWLEKVSTVRDFFGVYASHTHSRFPVYDDTPDNVIGIVHDKSTLARLGIACQNTVIEPGWEGYLTLEITNHANKRPWWKFWERDNEVFLDDGTPIAQILFHYTDKPVEKSYDGKYHHQARGPQEAIFE